MHAGADRQVNSQRSGKATNRRPLVSDGTAAAHTYDKSKDRWEKFDVEAALAEADNDTFVNSDTAEAHDSSAVEVCATLLQACLLAVQSDVR